MLLAAPTPKSIDKPKGISGHAADRRPPEPDVRRA
jgi:hypothetical protein